MIKLVENMIKLDKNKMKCVEKYDQSDKYD